MGFFERWSHLLIGTASLAIYLIAFLILAAALKEWPGEVNSCLKPPAPASKKAPPPKPLTGSPPQGAISDPARLKDCYCEALRAGNIRQPICTFTALAFSLGGLLILWWVGMERGGSIVQTYSNTMSALPGYKAAYGYVILAMGPGSMMFHATMTSWGGWIDQLSMLFFLCYAAAYNLAKLQARLGLIVRWREVVFGVLFAVLVITFGAILAKATTAGTYIFIAAACVVGFSEYFWCWYFSRNWWWLGSCTLTMGLAVVWWLFSQGLGPACDPKSPFQWHGLWHFTAAAFVTMIFFYLRTEAYPEQASSSVAMGDSDGDA